MAAMAMAASWSNLSIIRPESAGIEPKPAYLEEVEDEELDIDAPAADDGEPDENDLEVLRILEEDDVDITDDDLDDEEVARKASATLQDLSSIDT
jgi:hypothetical protein